MMRELQRGPDREQGKLNFDLAKVGWITTLRASSFIGILSSMSTTIASNLQET